MTAPLIAFMSPGGGELIFVMLVLILLFGAKDAPRILRSIQTFLDKTQRAAASFRYRMMYGDLHQETTHDDPYDVEVDDPDDEDEPGSESDIESSKLETPKPGTKKPEPNS